MIIYFANRNLEIQGLAGTSIRNGYIIISDTKAEDIETGVASFECEIAFNKENRNALEEMAVAGNYLLRNNGEENEFYTIIESEVDTKNQNIYIYAEDAGLDLLNEIAGKYEATAAYTIETYINKYIQDSGFEIGINEVPDVITKKLSWDDETTVTERLASIASEFGGYEISFSFEIRGMKIERRYINIYEKRGKDIAEQLRLDRDIDRIITKKSVANLATAFSCTGGTPDSTESEEEPEPITLKGYEYDDGDFWVGDDGILRSREAVSKWNRFGGLNNYTDYAGHIVRSFSYETLSQATLCKQAIAELKKAREMEINYEIDIAKLPDNVKVGDRVNIVDDAGELYLNSRILLLETSVVDQSSKATLGEHLIKKSGISDTVAGLAAKFASQAAENAKAWAAAQAAKAEAESASAKADEAKTEAADAKTDAAEAKTEAENANSKADSATETANGASKSAAQAIADAAAANAKVTVVESGLKTVTTTANEAKNEAEAATSKAASAEDLAEAAQIDVENAQKDIDDLDGKLETVQQTMEAEYTRKTELSEVKANLETTIKANAAAIELRATKEEVAATFDGYYTKEETDAAITVKSNAITSEVAAKYTTKEESEELSTRITQTEEALTIEINAAKSSASAAQTTANEANTNAANAQSTADTARTEAGSATKTATNYLNFSSAGLIIGDMTASVLGRNVLIRNDSIDIRNNTVVLARYSDSKIQLGMNSTTSSIEMCGGKGTILVTDNMGNVESSDTLAVKARSSYLWGTELAGIVASNESSSDDYEFSWLTVNKTGIDMAVHYGVAESDGIGVVTGSEFSLNATTIYGLSDFVHFVSRYGTTLDSVAGYITAERRIYANGGVRLANGGQLTGLTTDSTEITMAQMNADNYIMFGYGGYANNIGRTYLDGNVVYLRSKGDIHLNPTGKTYFTKQLVMSNNTAVQSYKSDGTTAIAMAFLNSSNIAFFGGASTSAAASAVRLQTTNDYLLFQDYSASSTTNPSIFYPNTTNKCALGTSSHAWYRVYASNTTIAASDRRMKENIVPLGTSQVSTFALGRSVEQVDIHSELFDRLQPVQYNFIEGNSRVCYGLVAQDVIEAMAEIGIEENELDLVHHDTENDPETGEATDTYGIAYENLIALLIHEVQKLKAEVETLKTTA